MIDNSTPWDALVVGAGAAGLFAALRAKECSPGLRIAVLERSAKPLRKVAISGGGRCNVTHACHDLDWLLACYPRGGPRLEAILGRFMPEDTVAWFAQQGVKLKTEADGRMFPVSDRSETIIDCLLGCAKRRGVPLLTEVRVDKLKKRGEGLFELRTQDGKFLTHKVLLATGGASGASDWLVSLGHEMVPEIPSLFTFNSKHPVIDGLPGVSLESTELRLKGQASFLAQGPLLVTHWGLSGPAVLKLSAFAARYLGAQNYQAELVCDLLPHLSRAEVIETLTQPRSDGRVISASPFPAIPKRLWQRLVQQAGVRDAAIWRQLSAAAVDQMASLLKELLLPIQGKGIFKEEFVTAGGLPLHEIDPYSMESRRIPGLFIAGELLDVDGITGGFNFQNAWATGYIAGEGLSDA